MKRWFVIFSIATLYYLLSGIGLYLFDAGLVMTAITLYGLPSIVLAHYSHAPAAVLVSVACLGFGLGFILESVAHIYGLWYTIGFSETRLFGLVPLETLITYMFHAVFLVLLYELFFDDGKYTLTSVRDRMVAFFVFAFGTIVLFLIHQYLFSGFFLDYSYVWIISLIAACSVAALGVYRAYSIRFFDRLIHFTLLGAVPGAIALLLSITNAHKFFANPEQYLYATTIFGEMVALEEILLVFALPFLVATIYELYLDDRD